MGGPVRTLARSGSDPAVVTDRSGTTTVVWASRSWPGSAIRVVRRPAGGRWSRPVTLGQGAEPLVGVDDRGAVTVVWQTNRDGRTSGVAASRRPPRGPWQRPVRLVREREADYHPSPDQDEGDFGAHRLDLAVSPGGAALVAWQWGSDHRNRPYRIHSVFRPAAGPWGRVTRLSPRNWSSNPEAGVAPGGVAVVGHEAPEDGPTVARHRQGSGSWGRPRTVTSRETNGHEVLMDPAGRVTVVFDRFDGVHAARRSAAGAYRRSVELSSGTFAGTVVDRFGTVSVAAVRGSGAVQVVRRERSWADPVRVGESQPFTTAALSASHAGDLVVSWTSRRGRIVARSRVAGSGWTAPVRVSAMDGYFTPPAVSALDGGGAVVVWQSRGGRINTRTFR